VVTARHAVMNHVTEHIRSWAGDGFAVIEQDYDLIIANILPNPLKAMAADMTARTKEQGYIILSGLLQEQAAEIIACYSDLGFSLEHRIDRDEWSALLMRKCAT